MDKRRTSANPDARSVGLQMTTPTSNTDTQTWALDTNDDVPSVQAASEQDYQFDTDE